ncbi:MAG: TetR/AcrR family transcriptional regulator [Spirochaetota bacterium]
MARLTKLTGRGLDTQRELSEALIGLTLEKGFSSVTVRDITDRLGVDRTTFYLHFKDKDELVLATQRRILDELSSSFQGAADPPSRLRTLYERIALDRETWKAMLGFEEHQRFEGRFAEQLASLLPLFPTILASTAGSGSLPRTLVARFVSTTIRSSAAWWLDQGEAACTPAEMAELTMKMLMKGLG